jgi:CHASE3 domain sensor protein
MADNTELKVKAMLTNALLTIIAGLITLFGTITFNVFKSINEKLDTLATKEVRTEKDIEALKNSVSDQREETRRLTGDVNFLHTVQEAEADLLEKMSKSKKQ